MSKSEVEKFAKLMREWSMMRPGSEAALLEFLDIYRQPLVSALRLYAAEK